MLGSKRTRSSNAPLFECQEGQDPLAYYHNKPHPGSPTKHKPLKNKATPVLPPWSSKGISKLGGSDDEDAVGKGVASNGGTKVWYKRKPYPEGIDFFDDPERCIPWWCNLDEQCVGKSKTPSKLLPSMQKLLVGDPSYVLFNPNVTIQSNALLMLGKLGEVLKDDCRMGIEDTYDSFVLTHPVQEKKWWKVDAPSSKKKVYKVYTWMCMEVDPTKLVEHELNGNATSGVYVLKGQGYVGAVLGHKSITQVVKPRKGGGHGNTHNKVKTIVEVGHRLVYWAMMGPPKDGHVVMHSCEKHGCLGPHCLIEGTSEANNSRDKDAYKLAEGAKMERFRNYIEVLETQ